MLAAKIQSNLPAQSGKKRFVLYVSPEVKGLIGELLTPRIEMLQKVVSTRMLAETQNGEDVEAGGDWWPDYSICSDLHYMTEMNGLIHLTQNTLRGMSEELRTIGVKFQDFVMNYFKGQPLESKDSDKPKDKEKMLGRYLLVQSLIKDLVTFTNCCTQHANKLQAQRSAYSERATSTKDTQDRIRLKIFDERSFNKLQSRMNSLLYFVKGFGALFELALDSSLPANEQCFSSIVESTMV